MNITFNHAGFLGLLAIVLPLVALGWYASYKGANWARDRYGENGLLKPSPLLSLKFQLPVLAGWLLAAALLVVSTAGPVMKLPPRSLSAGTTEVVVVQDVSRSMGSEEYKDEIPASVLARFAGHHGSKLDMAKYIVQARVLTAMHGNRVGFVNYRGEGFQQGPLTDDFTALNWVLENWVTIGNAPGNGSDYALGLLEAVKIFDRSGQQNAQRVIVLFSDGGYTGKPETLATAVEELKKRNIRLVVLGLGSSTPQRIPEYNSYNGERSGWVQEAGATATTQLDERPLKALADRAGGIYMAVESGNPGINWPTTIAGRDKVALEQQDVYHIPLMIAMALIVLLSLLGLITGTVRGNPVRFTHKQ